MAQLKITLTKSLAGRIEKHIATANSLGLKKINSSNTLEATPAVLGMAEAVSHLITVEEVK